MTQVVKLKQLAAADARMAAVRKLYEASFPESERRPWASLLSRVADCEEYSLYAIEAEGNSAGSGEEPASMLGFMTVWDLGCISYIEHFAVEPQKRGHGIGEQALQRLRELLPKGRVVLLEAERPEEGEMARRRIAFYERCGFAAHHAYDYVQPPYRPGLPEVPLVLMTSGGIADEAALQEAERLLRSKVYEADSGPAPGSQ